MDEGAAATIELEGEVLHRWMVHQSVRSVGIKYDIHCVAVVVDVAVACR